MLVNEFLESSADRLPGKTALVCGRQRLSFLDIEHLANRLANGFLALGLQKHDRVAIFLEPSVEAVAAVFAALKAGGVFVVINPQVKPEKLKYIINDCQAKLLVTDDWRLRAIQGEREKEAFPETVISVGQAGKKPPGIARAAGKLVSFADIVSAFSPDRPARRCLSIDLAGLIYTSGSTGQPKGVMLSHLNIATAAGSIIEYLGNSQDDIIINVLPLSFDYGLYQVLMAFKFGGTLVQERSFLYPHKTLALMSREKVTGFPLVPAVAAIMFKLRHLRKYDLRSLRYITNTAQALPESYIARLRALLPQAKIFLMYGLTECKRVSYLPPEELKRRPTSVGKAMPDSEAFIVDSDGRKIDQPGIIGELVVRGAHVMMGYWNLPDETNRVLRPGPFLGERLLYTGDLFKMDRGGFLYFVARKDEMLKVAGVLVSPREVENALHRIPDVQEAVVVGVEDDITGQAVKAFIVLRQKSRLKKAQIRALSSRYLENYMVPKYVEFRKSLPRCPHGKIANHELE